MRIVNIFDLEKTILYSVQYDIYETHEWDRLFEYWNDPEFLVSFFEEHKTDLCSGFFGEITINEAILQTYDDAAHLQDKILAIARAGSTDIGETLQSFFRQLYDDDARLYPLQKFKAHGEKYKSWLRLYAIRMGPNCFFITGGAIKLTKTMEEREHTKQELEKLEITRQFLKDNGILDEDDIEFVELIFNT